MDDQGAEPLHVLHVDDDPPFADLVRRHLERAAASLDLQTETSPTAALEAIRADPPDCVVSDFDMPDMDGLELLRAVREAYPELPFVLFTGKGSEEIASEAISAGVTDYIQKGGGGEKFELMANRVANAAEAHRVETAYDHEHEKLTALFESSPDAIVEYHVEGEHAIVEAVNPAFVETFGVPEQEAVGRSVGELIVPTDRRDEGRDLNRRASTEGRFRREVRREAADGMRDFLLTSIPLSTAEEGYAVYTDVTEARERERRLETLVSNLPGIVYRCRNEPEWPMVFVAGDAESLVGYTADQLEGGDVVWSDDVLVAGENERLWDEVQGGIKAREPFRVSYDVETADGRVRRMWEQGRGVFDENGELEALEGFITDVTSHQRLTQAFSELPAVLNDQTIEPSRRVERALDVIESVELEPLFDS